MERILWSIHLGPGIRWEPDYSASYYSAGGRKDKSRKRPYYYRLLQGREYPKDWREGTQKLGRDTARKLWRHSTANKLKAGDHSTAQTPSFQAFAGKSGFMVHSSQVGTQYKNVGCRLFTATTSGPPSLIADDGDAL